MKVDLGISESPWCLVAGEGGRARDNRRAMEDRIAWSGDVALPILPWGGCPPSGILKASGWLCFTGWLVLSVVGVVGLGGEARGMLRTSRVRRGRIS